MYGELIKLKKDIITSDLYKRNLILGNTLELFTELEYLDKIILDSSYVYFVFNEYFLGKLVSLDITFNLLKDLGTNLICHESFGSYRISNGSKDSFDSILYLLNDTYIYYANCIKIHNILFEEYNKRNNKKVHK